MSYTMHGYTYYIYAAGTPLPTRQAAARCPRRPLGIGRRAGGRFERPPKGRSAC